MKFISNTILFYLLLVASISAQSFGPQQEIDTNAHGAYSVYATDLDGDGDADVLSASYSTNKIAWYENIGINSGTFGAQQVITTNANNAYSVYAIDLDADGDADVLSASIGDNRIAWYENVGAGNGVGGGTFGPQQTITTSANYAYSVYATDLDGDGDADVLSASFWGDNIAWYENLGIGNGLNGGAFSAPKIISNNANGAVNVYATDLDGDGDADVLSALYGGNILWYKNLGGGTFSGQQVIVSGLNGATDVHATDLDSDGDMDVLSASQQGDKIAWYENMGPANPGTFGAQQIITASADGARSVYATDLDNDGDADVLSASNEDNRIAWYENLGGGTFGTQQVITTNAQYAMSVYATDLDGDGDADVLSASGADNKIAWYENLDWGLAMEETPSLDLNFSFSHGFPSASYYAFYTLNTLNSSSPYTGAFFGLHIHMPTIWDQLSLAYSGDPIFGGILDASGTSTAVYNQVGLGALSGLTVWAVTIQEIPGQTGVFEASPITEFTFL